MNQNQNQKKGLNQQQNQTKKRPKVNFLGYECDVVLGKYDNKRTALRLMHPNEGPIAVATVNIMAVSPITFGVIAKQLEIPEDRLLFINDHVDNRGSITDSLVEAGVVRKTPITIPTGYVNAEVCVLLID